MTQPGYNSKTLSVAMLTVCADRDVVEKLLQPTMHMPWAVMHANFEQYISLLQRPQFSPEIKNADAVVAVVDFDQDAEQALETACYLQRLFFGRIALVALCGEPDADLLLRAMRAGCSEFLEKPVDPAQFNATLSRLEEQWSNTMGRRDATGHILSFFGAKGGVGTTTVAIHLAVYLVCCHQKKVLLIDNHRDLGHVCLYLGLDGNRYHFNELMRNVSRLDSDLLRGFIATHQSGLEVLSSPDSHDELRSIDPDAIEQTLEFLRGEYDYVILDCEMSFAEANLAVMHRSDRVYLVATAEIGAIRNLSSYVDGLIQSAHTTERLHVVINRYSSQNAIGIEHIEKAIRLPVDIRICNNYVDCLRAVNVGEPIAPEHKSEFAMQFRKWAGTLANANGSEPGVPAKKRFALWR